MIDSDSDHTNLEKSRERDAIITKPKSDMLYLK